MSKQDSLTKARIIKSRFSKNRETYVIDIYYKLIEKHNLICKGYM